MTIAYHINTDIQFLENQIESALNYEFKLTRNGKRLRGKQEEEEIQKIVKEYQDKIFELRGMLRFNLIPKTYTTLRDQTIHTATACELQQAKNALHTNHFAYANKNSRKIRKDGQSNFELFQTLQSRFMHLRIEHNENKEYPSGGISAKVKSALDEHEKRYALKIFDDDHFDDDMHDILRVAMRGAYCNRLLGRTGIAFRNNGKQYLLTEWLPGKPLATTPRDSIICIPIYERIKIAAKLVYQLAILHSQHILHNDIKPANVMFDGMNLYLFDFDGVRVEGESADNAPFIAFSKRYFNPDVRWEAAHDSDALYQLLTKKTDLFALGLTLPYLFPDIITPKSEKRSVQIDEQAQFLYDSVGLYHTDLAKKHLDLATILKTLTRKDARSARSCVDLYNSLALIAKRYPEYKTDSAPLKSLHLVDTPKEINVFDEVEEEVQAFHKLNAKFSMHKL